MEPANFDVWSSAGSKDTLALATSIASKRQSIETPFYVIDLDDISYKLKLWREVLPRIKPHYGEEASHYGGLVHGSPHSAGSEQNAAISATRKELFLLTIGDFSLSNVL